MVRYRIYCTIIVHLLLSVVSHISGDNVALALTLALSATLSPSFSNALAPKPSQFYPDLAISSGPTIVTTIRRVSAIFVDYA